MRKRKGRFVVFVGMWMADWFGNLWWGCTRFANTASLIVVAKDKNKASRNKQQREKPHGIRLLRNTGLGGKQMRRCPRESEGIFHGFHSGRRSGSGDVVSGHAG